MTKNEVAEIFAIDLKLMLHINYYDVDLVFQSIGVALYLQMPGFFHFERIEKMHGTIFLTEARYFISIWSSF